MISIEDVHKDIRGILKKNDTYFASPEDIDSALYSSCIDILNEEIENYSKSGKFKIDHELLFLHPFTGSSEIRDLPTDVFKVEVVLNSDYEGDLLGFSKFNNRLNSAIIPPSTKRPVATIYNHSTGKKIRILPATSTHSIKYWRNPVKPVYNYTSSIGVITYNPTGSVDIDFPLSYKSKIMNRALIYLLPATKNVEAAQMEQNILK